MHNVIIHINRSPQRILKFEEKVKEIQPNETIQRLTVGCPTRWSSDHDSLELALRFQPSIDAYVDSEITTQRRARDQPANRRGGRRRRGTTPARPPDAGFDFLDQDELALEDWEVLKAVHSILRPMRQVTLHLQGKTTTALVSEVLPAMNMMLARYEKVCVYPLLIRLLIYISAV